MLFLTSRAVKWAEGLPYVMTVAEDSRGKIGQTAAKWNK